MIEVWKDINGYEGLYMVSNMGNVKSLNYSRTGKERVLNTEVRKDGYLMVTLCKDGKTKGYTVHRLVAKAFISNPNGYPVVNHKDCNPLNNRSDNLEWCTYSYNNTYNDRHLKAAEKLSRPIYCIELNKVFPSIIEAFRQTGVDYRHLSDVCKGKRKSAGGYHWQYAEK